MKKIKFFITGPLAILCYFYPDAGLAQSMSMGHEHGAARHVFLSMMDTMMTAMAGTPVPSSPEAGFLTEMIPHHQGAIKMAQYEILHGKDIGMIQLAKSILAEQSSEIEQMNIWLKQVKPVKWQPSGFQHAMDKAMTDMMEQLPTGTDLGDTDHAFARVMMPHHQAAIEMAATLIGFPADQQIAAYARQLISNEKIEVEQMKNFIN